MSHSYVSNLIHCVFSTKQRKKAISADLEQRLWPFIGGIARENKMKALAVGGTEDHIHALLSLPATVPIAKAIQLIETWSQFKYFASNIKHCSLSRRRAIRRLPAPRS